MRSHLGRLEVSLLAAAAMKALLRLYPRAWRERFGREMGALLEEMPTELGTALDLLIGALAANAAVIRSNRILSSAAAFLHGVCVAFLVLAIGFVSLVLASQLSANGVNVSVGPFQLASVVFLSHFLFNGQRALTLASAASLSGLLPAIMLLVALAAILTATVAGPRFIARRAP